MRLAKFTSQKNSKNAQQKYELQPQQQLSNSEWGTKGQAGGFVKRFSGTLSILSSNNSGSVRSSVAGVNNAPRNSFGNGSCISSSASTNNTCSTKRRKSKTSKCFSSTVFRCCLPCRGGSGSAAPATSPPHTPASPTNITKADSTVKRKRSGKTSIDLTTDGNDSFIQSVKKHSLADTIGTSATTPISLKNLINDDDEELQQHQHISAADIAAATLASGILPRKAEPETLSDTSISPTTAVLQLAAARSASASSLLSTTTTLLSTVTTTAAVATQTALTVATQSSPTTPPNSSSQQFNYSSLSSSTTVGTNPIQPATTTASSTSPTNTPANNNNTTSSPSATASSSSSTPSRCCCPPPQTSPLPHIKEEEESEQLLQRQHSANQEDETTSTEPTSERQQYKQQQQQQQQSPLDQLSPYTTANTSGSSESCTSLSATAAATTTTSSITGCTPQEFTTSTPSPRIKHKFRKQHKSGWSRIIFAPNSSITAANNCGAANSSETLASSSNNSSSAATVSAAIAAAQTRLASSSASALAQQSTSSQLLPASKMQAEQGSIGDLQKYHSRYLKNRRHTLANVRDTCK